MNSFIFPEDPIEEVTNKSHLLQILSSFREEKFQFRCREIRERYLYINCSFKNCKAEMRFKRKEDTLMYHLEKDFRQHKHSYEKRQHNGVYAFIKEMPLTIGIAVTKQLVMNQFKISQSQFYYIFRKVKNQKMSFKELVNNLNEMDCDIRSDPFTEEMDELPGLMIIVTPKMKENFLKFGNWVGFDFTFNIVQETLNGKNWKVGCFMGISSSKKMVSYGLVLSTEETEERFYQIFKSFFDIMKKEPKVIISDEDHALAAALKNLARDNEFSGVHLLDCYHIMKNVKKNLQNKQYWSLFKELIYQETKEEYEIKLNECLEAIDNEQDMKLLQRFVNNSPSYCFSQTPPVFFGFLPNTSMNEKLHDLLKAIIPYSKPFTVVVTTIIQYLEDMGDKCHTYQLETSKIEVLFTWSWLKEIRYLVCKSIFSKIVQQFSKSISYETVESSEDRYLIKTGKTEMNLRKLENKWTCFCEYLEKTGIPCSHLLRILFLRKSRISPYINSHWLSITTPKKEIKKFQRKTRRNQVK